MTHHGFRLYEVTLRRGAKQRPVPFEKAGVTPEGPRHFREELLELLEDLRGRRLVGQPTVQSAEGAGGEEDEDAPLQERLFGEIVFLFEDFRAADQHRMTGTGLC